MGDIEGNGALVEASLRDAAGQGADLALLPELVVCGYPPKDLLFVGGFVEECMLACERIADGVRGGLTALVGSPWLTGDGSMTNSLLVMRDGRIEARYDKRLLPTYDVFDEDRYFRAGDAPLVIEVGGVRVGLSICEDLWRGADAHALMRYEGKADPVEDLVRAGAELIVNPSGSPFVLGKARAHRRILMDLVSRHRIPIAAVNQLGGNDELVFNGHAALFVPEGEHGARLALSSRHFSDEPLVVDLDSPPERAPFDPVEGVADEEHLFRALVLGVRDYCRKTGFKGAVIGLSGGIDSAVTAAIAASALGPGRVLGLAMPSRYSSAGSVEDAQDLADRLGMRMLTVPIEGGHDAVRAALETPFASLGFEYGQDITDENVQARLRGLTLMAFSNKTGDIVLTTGNKSELAVGYCTLYGDMNGGLAVLSDVTKAQVYRLAGWMNENPGAGGFGRAPIPQRTIDKPPSAELRPDQTDQDSLPPYDTVDLIVERYVERRQHPREIHRETGIDAATIAQIVRLIDVNEYKRKQAALGLKVTSVAFGSGRRMPIAQRWRPERSI